MVADVNKKMDRGDKGQSEAIDQADIERGYSLGRRNLNHLLLDRVGPRWTIERIRKLIQRKT